MGQYGNQPDFGTRAVAITPKGFAGGSYINVSYQDDEDNTQNIYLTSTNLNVSTFRDGTPIAKASNTSEWSGYYNEGTPCWAYYDFNDDNEKFGKIYNSYAANNNSLYSPGFQLLPDYIVQQMSTGYNDVLGLQLKSVPMGEPGQDVSGTTLWEYSPNKNTNIFGFTGLPGGFFDGNDYSFQKINAVAPFWAEYVGDGENWYLPGSSTRVQFANTNDQYGYYIRLQVDPHNLDYTAPEPLNSAALYVGTGGDLVVTIVGSEIPVMFKNVPDASFLPIIVSNVWERGDMGLTTASDIIAIY